MEHREPQEKQNCYQDQEQTRQDNVALTPACRPMVKCCLYFVKRR